MKNATLFSILLAALIGRPWPILGAWAQRQLGGSPAMGAVTGLLFGPIGLLITGYSGWRTCPACRATVGDRRATACRHCGAAVV